MTRPTITLAQLEAANACQSQVDLFKEKFGESTTITVAKAKRVARVFNWLWAAARLLDAPAQTEYDRAWAAARAEYERARTSAWAEFERARTSAWAEFERARTSAWAEYDRAMAAAFAEAYIAMWEGNRHDT